MSDDTYFEEDGREYYKSNGCPVWPRRYRELPSMKDGSPKGDLIDDPFVRRMIAGIDEAERKTRPSLGEASAAAKDLAAFSALRDAAWLVEYVAGWAIDHQRGLALKSLGFVPLQPSQTNSHPEYLEARSAVDHHEHERSGGQIETRREEMDPLTARHVLLNILLPMAGHLGVPHRMITALKALDYGEITPELRKADNDLKSKLTERTLQLLAIAFVEYEVAKGRKKFKAQKAVADHFGIGQDTVRGWERQLREFFGDLKVSAQIAVARNCGTNYLRDERAKFAGDITARPSFFEERFGLPALLDAAEMFKKRGQSA